MFVRKSQSFPDVRLTRQTLEGSETVLGIELKGWYALSKERVPSFRYQIAVDACATMDLICVVPWYLDNAVSGEAKVLAPWVEQARYAAEWRDYWWEHVRDCKGGAESRRVIQPESVSPYPSKADAAHAVPVSDSGGNFGRLPRAKPLMDSFIERVMKEEVLGIPLEDWVCFISMHTDSSDPEAITAKLASKVKEEGLDLSEQKAAELLCVLRKLTDFNFG